MKRRDSVWIKKTLRFDGSLLQKCDTVQKAQEYFYLKLFPETGSQVLHKNGNSSEIHWPCHAEAQSTAKIDPRVRGVRGTDLSILLTPNVFVAKVFFLSTLQDCP